MALCFFKHDSSLYLLKTMEWTSFCICGGEGGSYCFKSGLKFTMVRIKKSITSVRLLLPARARVELADSQNPAQGRHHAPGLGGTGTGQGPAGHEHSHLGLVGVRTSFSLTAA